MSFSVFWPRTNAPGYIFSSPIGNYLLSKNFYFLIFIVFKDFLNYIELLIILQIFLKINSFLRGFGVRIVAKISTFGIDIKVFTE